MTAEQPPLDGHSMAHQVKWLFCALYLLVFVFGMLGNSLFCFIVTSSRTMNSVTYQFLLNLSVSDLLVICLCGPVHVVQSLIIGYWPFGELGCYVFSFLQCVTVLVSSYTLVVISFERYVSILRPLRQSLPRSRARLMIVLIWIVCALMSVPNGLLTVFVRVDDHAACTVDMDNLVFHYYSLVLGLVQYFVPLVLMTFCYSMVAVIIWRRRNLCPMECASQRQSRQATMLSGRKKMIKMLMVVVVCYTVCWLPFNVYWVMGLVQPWLLRHWTFPYVFTSLHLLALLQACFNPLIYCWMNSRVRCAVLRLLGSLCPGTQVVAGRGQPGQRNQRAGTWQSGRSVRRSTRSDHGSSFTDRVRTAGAAGHHMEMSQLSASSGPAARVPESEADE